MKRYAETVLNGHPDKFCDLVADRLVNYAYKQDKIAFAQVEASVWSNQIFLTGAIATSSKIDIDVTGLIHKLGNELGYTKDNHIAVTNYKIHDHICKLTKQNENWTDYVNDQCIITGYAGYDEKTQYLPPEQFAAWFFREHVIRELKEEGLLQGQGPDGKLLLVMDENSSNWKLESLLLTLQQHRSSDYTKFVDHCAEVLFNIYQKLKIQDNRWTSDFKDIGVLINPNGSFIEGGSEGDNGQTGRKLVIDYYGPRIPIGGGAIYGKCLTHVDRLGAYAARRYALEQCKQGAGEVMINLCYAPGISKPLDITIKSSIKPHKDPYEYFDSGNLVKYIDDKWLDYDLYKLGTFYNENAGMHNRLAQSRKHQLMLSKIVRKGYENLSEEEKVYWRSVY